MAVKAKVASLDGVDEALKAHYTAGEDGAYYFAVEGIEEMPAVRGLKAKNTELLDKNVKLNESVKAYGMTPEEVAALKEQASKGGGGKAEEIRAEYETKLKQTSEQAQKEIQTAKEQAKAEQDAARRYFQTGEITRAIGGAKGVPELLSHVVEQHVKVERGEDGAFSLKVIGKDGQPRIKDSQGAAYSLDDLVSELKADPKYGRAFEAEGKGGSGAAPNGNGGAGGAKTIRAGDLDAFGANLEAIAKGTVTVAQ